MGRHAQTEEQVISPEHECHYLPPLHPCALHRAAQGRVRRRIFILPGQEAVVNPQRSAAANHMRNYLSILCPFPFHRECVSLVQTGTRAGRRPLPLTIRDSTWLDDSCDIAFFCARVSPTSVEKRLAGSMRLSYPGPCRRRWHGWACRPSAGLCAWPLRRLRPRRRVYMISCSRLQFCLPSPVFILTRSRCLRL